jgi:drug/metabolite transporter (DMT)-like permease
MPQGQASKAAPVEAQAGPSAAGSARLLVLLLAFAWGLNWIAAAIALPEVPPWSLRFAGSGIGALTLFSAALLTGHDLHVPPGERIHVIVAGFFNVVMFQILSAFAQLEGATSRAIIIAYSMPIWATMLSRLLLRERLNGVRWLALALCVSGLTILIWPLVAGGAGGVPRAVFFALGCAFSWAFATVYVKWMKVSVAPLANAAWQLLFGFCFIAVGTFAFDGYPRLWPVHTDALLAVLYVGLLGVGLAHFLWWSIVGKLSPVTASIGALLSPVVGVSASAIVLGERLSVPDIVGFALIFAAAACVLLQPTMKHTEMPE